jgi:hypothetical protein
LGHRLFVGQRRGHRRARGSDTTLRARRDEWIAAGVFDALRQHALHAYDRIIGLDLSEVALDGSIYKAPCGGEGTGKNPTDRAKIGWKWSIATDAHVIPIGCWARATDGRAHNVQARIWSVLEVTATHWVPGPIPQMPQRIVNQRWVLRARRRQCHCD